MAACGEPTASNREPPILLKTRTWQIEVGDDWQDHSTDDLIRLVDPSSDAVLVISSFSNDVGASLAQWIAAEVEKDKQAGCEVTGVQISESVLAAYCEGSSVVKAYVTAAKSTLFMTLTPVGDLTDAHRHAMRQILKNFKERSSTES